MTASSPPPGPFRLAPALPGDKSITHRAYLLGALAEGTTAVRRGNEGADCRATLEAVCALGAGARREGDAVIVAGTGGRFRPPGHPLDLGNSGTGLRLLLGVLAAHRIEVTLTGDASLRRRPVERVLEPLRRLGAAFTTAGDHPPVTVRGGPLAGIRYRLPVPSAQVKSAVLLAGIQARGTTAVVGGRGTRDHTERLLPCFQVPVRFDGDGAEVAGPARPRGADLVVPGDPSAGAFYLAAAALVEGSEVILEDVGLNPLRTAAFHTLERMGLELRVEAEAAGDAEARGRVTARRIGPLVAPTLNSEEVPALIDELPILAVAAAFARGVTVVTGAGELRHKESDRLQAVADGLRAIGADAEIREDGWRIRGSGGASLPGGEVDPRGDHRVAMAFLVAGLACRDGVRLRGPHGIETSDPGFLSHLAAMGSGTSPGSARP